MSFTYDASTDIGKVRTLIYDTSTSDYAFTDEAIQGILDLNSSSIWLTASDLCRSLAAKNAPDAFLVKISTALEVDKKKVAQMFLDLSDKYMTRANGSADMVWEYVDSFNLGTTLTGIDTTEYVED